MTEDDIRLRDIMDTTPDALENVAMIVHRGFFRFAFQDMDSTFDGNNCELLYNINDPSAAGLPKWSLIKGTNVWSYSVWDNYGDLNELLTGRSDIGKVMYHNRTDDFDGNPIECIVRTAEITASEEDVVRFKGFYIKAKPGNYTTQSLFRYYINGRLSVRADSDFSLRGETRDLGTIHISTQALFNDRIVPLSGYSLGNSIAFEIYDFSNGTKLEIYSISFTAQKRYKIRNQLVG